ncbi:MAG TPA: UMP kinase, partial [Deltaproteobacteria bacterium]|nr:UMP kinase [Deltaproteobacteria bacterium]
LERGEIVIFAGGTGNPFFTTDTTAALRAIEINANVIFKATKVDGVYDKDPKLFKNAKFFHTLSFREALKRNLKVMDATAMLLCMEYNIPVVVFDIKGKNNLKRLVSGERIGTIVRR